MISVTLSSIVGEGPHRLLLELAETVGEGWKNWRLFDLLVKQQEGE